MKIALLPMAILFSILGACAGVVEENFIASATLGQDGDDNYHSSVGFYNLEKGSFTEGWYLQVPFYTALAVLFDEDDEHYPNQGEYHTGDPYDLTLPMNVSVGRVFPLNEKMWAYLGAGVGFVHKTGAVETAIPDIVRDYSSTRDARFNVNTGLLCPLVGPIGVHLNYDSAFNVASFGILFTEVF